MEMLEDTGPTEKQRLDLWRTRELEKRGFEGHAVELLVLAQVDLHDVDRLLQAGCPHTTALMILL